VCFCVFALGVTLLKVDAMGSNAKSFPECE
jgi:hypothetical protein